MILLLILLYLLFVHDKILFIFDLFFKKKVKNIEISDIKKDSGEIKVIDYSHHSKFDHESPTFPLNDKDIHKTSKQDEVVDVIQNNERLDLSIKLYGKISQDQYLQQYIKNNDVGKIGELIAIGYEKEYLINIGKSELARNILHVSHYSDKNGFDILSYDQNGNDKHIEVKTTTSGFSSDFYLSQNEFKKIQSSTNYLIYRIYDLDLSTGIGKLRIIDCKNEFEKYFTLVPSVYQVKSNRGS